MLRTSGLAKKHYSPPFHRSHNNFKHSIGWVVCTISTQVIFPPHVADVIESLWKGGFLHIFRLANASENIPQAPEQQVDFGLIKDHH